VLLCVFSNDNEEKMPVKQNWTVFGEILTATTTFIACLTRFHLISHPFENLHGIPTSPWGFITVPIPSHTHGNPHTHGSLLSIKLDDSNYRLQYFHFPKYCPITQQAHYGISQPTTYFTCHDVSTFSYTDTEVIISLKKFPHSSRQKVDSLHDVEFGAGCKLSKKCCTVDFHAFAQMTDRHAVATTSTRYLQPIRQMRAALNNHALKCYFTKTVEYDC